MKPESVTTSEAPVPVGPYSQAMKTGCLVFVSGQLGIDPSTGKLAEGVEAQAEQALGNIRAILSAAGCGMERVIKTTILLADMSDFVSVNAIYAGFFVQPFPARATYAVAALPLGAKVEIEAVASVERKDN
jgi:2-iminobutanoate/2-iminopropanoate deaminase